MRASVSVSFSPANESKASGGAFGQRASRAGSMAPLSRSTSVMSPSPWNPRSRSPSQQPRKSTFGSNVGASPLPAGVSMGKTASNRSLIRVRSNVATTAPPSRLKELCMKVLEGKFEKETLSRSWRRKAKKVSQLRMKYRAAVVACGFTALLVRRRMDRLAAEQSQNNDAYTVLPGVLDLSEHGDLGELCIFLVRLQKEYCDDFYLTFALFRVGPVEHQQWVVQLLEDVYRLHVARHFVSTGESVDNTSVVVFCRYDPVTKRLNPKRSKDLNADLAQYYVIHDFKRAILSVTAEDEETVEESSELEQLTNMFSVPLPRHSEFLLLPKEVQLAIRGVAIETLRCFLYPRLVLKFKKRHRRKLIQSSYVARLMPENMGSLSIFGMWPAATIELMVSYLMPMVCEKGEFILHEDEHAGGGIFFLVSGTVDVLKKRPADKGKKKGKSLGPENTIRLVGLKATCCFGEYAPLTEEPRMASIRATSQCSLWVLSREDFLQLFKTLPQGVSTQITDSAFQKRTANMLNTYPLNIAFLRSCKMFEKSSDALLERMIPAFRPQALPKGSVVTKAGEPARKMYFLRHGVCGVFRYVEERKEEMHIAHRFPPSVIGDDGVLFSGPYSATTRATTNIDAYTLTKEDFEGVLASDPDEWQTLMQHAEETRQQVLGRGQYRYKDQVINVPLLRDYVPLGKRGELIHLFVPKVYQPRQAVCSTAHFADKVVILVEGSVRVGETGVLQHGEAVGYTCVVPHRWAKPAIAMDVVKVLELPLAVYETFLKESNAYGKVLTAVKALMFPRAAADEDLYRAVLATQHLKSPAMHPTSQDDTVNPYKPNFGMEVVNHGSRNQGWKRPQSAAPTVKRAEEIYMDKINEKAEGRRKFRGGLAALPERKTHWSRGGVLLIPRVAKTPKLD